MNNGPEFGTGSVIQFHKFDNKVSSYLGLSQNYIKAKSKYKILTNKRSIILTGTISDQPIKEYEIHQVTI